MSRSLTWCGLSVLGTALALWLWARSGPPPQAVPAQAPQEDVREGVPPASIELKAPQDEAAPPAVERSTVAIAQTVSAPTLTYEGHLIEKIQQSIRDDYPFGQGKPSVDSRLDLLAKEEWMNPKGKVLTAEQLAQLRSLVDRFDLQTDEEEREYWRLTRSALVAAAEQGRFMVRESSVIEATDPAEISRQIQSHTQDMRRMQEEMMTELSARLGVPMRDWAYTQAATFEPDGIPRFAIVYFTRQHAPDVFASGDRQTELARRKRSEVRQFFANLP